MLTIPFYGIQIGLGVTLVAWTVFIGWCLMAGRGKRSVALGTLAAIVVVFPVASVGAMYGITPFFEYQGVAGTMREWNETWVRPPENTVKIGFEKKIISGAFYGTTDRASWDAWREKNGMIEPLSTPDFRCAFLHATGPESGTWSGYGSKVMPNGARQRTWFREEDGTVAYYANYW